MGQGEERREVIKDLDGALMIYLSYGSTGWDELSLLSHGITLHDFFWFCICESEDGVIPTGKTIRRDRTRLRVILLTEAVKGIMDAVIGFDIDLTQRGGAG